MGFNSVYRFLTEIFPQIDSRLLKAVAIEHSKDADAAANVILTEILPFWSQSAVSSASLPENQNTSSFAHKDQRRIGLVDEDLGAEYEEPKTFLRRRRIAVTSKDKDVVSAMEPRWVESGHDTDTDLASNNNCDLMRESSSMNRALVVSADSHFYDANDDNSRLSESSEGEELILLGKIKETSIEAGSSNVSVVSASTNCNSKNADLIKVISDSESNESVSLDKAKDINEQNPTTLKLENGVLSGSSNDVNVPIAISFPDTSLYGLNNQGESCLDHPVLNNDNSVVQLAGCSTQEPATDALDCALQAGSGSGTTIIDCEIPDTDDSLHTKSVPVNCTNGDGHLDNESSIDAVVTRSGQICRVDLLEKIIEDAKTNKKTLFSAMESVMNLMREVEVQEKAAEEAKAEATRGGLDTLIKAEELKLMLVHAKEANDMHAGEIYGEKAILATEARELQTRLLSLTEERDKSLAVLDQMRVTLEARFAAAEEVIKSAEEEKLQKNELARSCLAEQEAIMEKVVQESKLLQQEAEENSKLREFLIDRGHVVDSLQGEISVICQDVKLLKEKFDERVPLSQSISSSQTTCILASSGSSSRSVASLVGEQGIASETQEQVSPTPSVHLQSPKMMAEEYEQSGDARRELMEDGWEIFDKDIQL